MTRIGLLYPDAAPASPGNWSGTPRGLYEGFASLGMEVVPIPCRLSPFLRLPVALLARVCGARGIAARREPVYARARTAVMAAALRQAGRLDALVAMGTDLYDLRRVICGCPVPVATYDDGNLALFLRYRDSDVCQSGLPSTVIERWARRQAIACRSATVACVSTSWAKNSAVKDFGLPEPKVRVVGIGHRPRSGSGFTRDWTNPRFLFVGIDWRRKNGAAVVEAFARVREQFPEARLDLVGEHLPVDRPGVTDHGYLARSNVDAQRLLDQLYARATVFVLPSLFEPAGIVYLEAASAGLPVISTTCGGAGDLLPGAALSVDPYDRGALVDAMLQLADGDAARAMGARAAALAAESSWQDVSRRIADNLLGGSLGSLG